MATGTTTHNNFARLSAETALRQAALLYLYETKDGKAKVSDLHAGLDREIAWLARNHLTIRGQSVTLRKAGRAVAVVIASAFWRAISYDDNKSRRRGRASAGVLAQERAES